MNGAVNADWNDIIGCLYGFSLVFTCLLAGWHFRNAILPVKSFAWTVCKSLFLGELV